MVLRHQCWAQFRLLPKRYRISNTCGRLKGVWANLSPRHMFDVSRTRMVRLSDRLPHCMACWQAIGVSLIGSAVALLAAVCIKEHRLWSSTSDRGRTVWEGGKHSGWEIEIWWYWSSCFRRQRDNGEGGKICQHGPKFIVSPWQGWSEPLDFPCPMIPARGDVCGMRWFGRANWGHFFLFGYLTVASGKGKFPSTTFRPFLGSVRSGTNNVTRPNNSRLLEARLTKIFSAQTYNTLKRGWRMCILECCNSFACQEK